MMKRFATPVILVLLLGGCMAPGPLPDDDRFLGDSADSLKDERTCPARHAIDRLRLRWLGVTGLGQCLLHFPDCGQCREARFVEGDPEMILQIREKPDTIE